VCAAALPARTARAQEVPAPPPVVTVFPHPADTRWWLSAQVNLIAQAHGPFPSPYEGAHSFQPDAERTLSTVWTLYTGFAISNRTEVMFDLESAGGRGLSDALGLAGFTDLDVVRNPALGAAPYVARVIVRHVIPLSSDEVDVARGPLAVASHQPARRLEISGGKLGLPDFFDVNGPGSDSHLQFMNWTVDNNGAYDYAADTRGYTFGVVVQVVMPRWTLRGAEALMPTVANGIDLDWNVSRARGENLEFEWRPQRRLIAKTLAYLNHADMGSYEEAIAAFRAGQGATPVIEAHRRQGRRKHGFGGNIEYDVSDTVRLFGRAGWNDGRNESFAYTECDDTVLGGGDITGSAWHRPQDRAGLAAVSNGLSDVHREYLTLGGLGFLLGDGALRYGRETIVEGYYTAHIRRGVFASIGAQYIVNPGYNRDRGPVLVGSARLHVDF
jgi:high affinity Mn2+ porin